MMQWLTDEGHFRPEQVLAGLPHLSGASAERIAYFLGRKQSSHLSAMTNASVLDAARTALQAKVTRLA